MRGRLGRGRGRRRPYANSTARTQRELIPYPITWTPTSDPPSVRRNPVARITLDLELESPTDNVYTISVGSLRNRLILHSGIPKPNFILEKAAAWAAPGDDTLIITDAVTGVQMYDDGDFVRRARAGIFYPKNIQRFYDQAASGTVITVTSVTVPAFRAWIRYWDSDVAITRKYRECISNDSEFAEGANNRGGLRPVVASESADDDLEDIRSTWTPSPDHLVTPLKDLSLALPSE